MNIRVLSATLFFDSLKGFSIRNASHAKKASDSGFIGVVFLKRTEYIGIGSFGLVIAFVVYESIYADNNGVSLASFFRSNG